MRTFMATVSWILVLAAWSHGQLNVDFSANATSGPAAFTVQFDAQVTGGTPTVWQWNFGDGQIGSSFTPQIEHTYTEPGSYTVRLDVLALPLTGQATKSNYIAVTPASLVPDFTATPTTGPLLLDVQFSDATTGAGNVTSWAWSFGDGKTSSEQNPSHTYDEPGDYDVTLTVKVGSTTWVESKTAFVHADPAPLVPNMQIAPAAGPVPLTVAFQDASTGATPTKWHWSFGDGFFSNEQDPVHEYTVPGTYDVVLRVFIGQQVEEITVPGAVVVDPVLLVPLIGAANTTGSVPHTVTFQDLSGGVTPTDWLWDFGDGNTSTETNPQHTYETPGTYDVSLTIFAGQQNETLVETALVQIDPVPLTADFTLSTIGGVAPLSVDFQDLTTGTPPNGWLWDFGDGSTSTEANPTHVYVTPDVYTVTLTASYFGQDASATKAQVLDVQHAATLTVPGSAATIQGAIDLAADLTEILVAPGTYPEALDFGGKAITVRGSGAGQTIVDASGLGRSVVTVPFGASAGARIEDLTLTGGEANLGGGIWVDTSTELDVRRCVIRDNTAAGGGGLFTTSPLLTVEDCVIADNTATAGSGGGSRGYIIFDGCAFLGNTCAGDGGGAYAGTFTDCLFSGNSAEGQAGGAYAVGDMRGCLFVGNTSGDLGGGLFHYGGGFTIEDCSFFDNTAGVDHPGYGGGAYVQGLTGPTVVRRCVFAGNSATVGDGLRSGIGIRVESCTFVGDGIGTTSASGWAVDVSNSILRGAAPIQASASSTVTYSNVEGGWPGTGNTDVDPLFVDAAARLYALQPGSASIDAGDPEHAPDPDGSVVDMGALPFDGIYDVGVPLAGSRGLPAFDISGELAGGATLGLAFARGPASGSMHAVFGVTGLAAPFKGGLLMPQPLLIVFGLPLDASGSLAFDATWPVAVPSGVAVWMQGWFPDTVGPAGFSSTAGVVLVQP